MLRLLNTTHLVSSHLKKSNIKEPKDLEGKKYGTWNDPVELAMVKSLIQKQGGDSNKLNLAPNTDTNSVTPLENVFSMLLGFTMLGMVN